MVADRIAVSILLSIQQKKIQVLIVLQTAFSINLQRLFCFYVVCTKFTKYLCSTLALKEFMYYG